MKIRLGCVEDGVENIGFRKISASIKENHSETKICYIPTGNMRGFFRTIMGRGAGDLTDRDVHEVAKFLAEGDIVGLSSMTQYSSTAKKIIAEIRLINPKSYIVWGGIHPIIHPEDAINHADAICTGEGEFAFEEFFDLFKKGADHTKASGFWFQTDKGVIKNINLPLMTQQEMDRLPPLTYQDEELIFQTGKGFKPINYKDFLKYMGTSYTAVWSIGCPLKCTYCGNSKFIEYDKGYRRVRHSSPRTIINELKRAISKHPHISTIVFHDDSFLALPRDVIEEFSTLYKEEIPIPFAVGGVIPNYVREDKIAVLVDAGMNRVRMGIQSGSEKILDFYKRPTPISRIREALMVLNKFKDFMIPPAFDIILENPLETPDDTRATLDLLYEMPRPFTLNIFSLRIIPNTELAKDLEEQGVTVPPIDKNYHTGFQPTLGTILVFLLVVWRMPKWLYKFLRQKVFPVKEKQEKFPIFLSLMRAIYLIRRGVNHIRFMDFSVMPGKTGYYLWKFGVISFWQRFILKKYTLIEK